MIPLSSENLSLLPNPENLQEICKSISVLEAILSPEWHYRYYSYQKYWSENEQFCEMRNGQGDQMQIIFSDKGVCINGFAHESTMNGWKRVEIKEQKSILEKLFGSKKKLETELIQYISKGVIDNLPEEFKEFVFGEPVKSIGTTFCIWQKTNNFEWQKGNIDYPKDDYKDGSIDLLELLDGKPLTYKKWAEEYYEKDELNLEIIEQIFQGKPITKKIVTLLNSETVDFNQLISDIEDIGYEHEL